MSKKEIHAFRISSSGGGEQNQYKPSAYAAGSAYFLGGEEAQNPQQDRLGDILPTQFKHCEKLECPKFLHGCS